jgi:hypothetical protein
VVQRPQQRERSPDRRFERSEMTWRFRSRPSVPGGRRPVSPTPGRRSWTTVASHVTPVRTRSSPAPTRAACRRGRTAAPTARPAAASVSSRTRCFFGACGVFLSSSSAAGPRSGRVRVQFWLHVSVSDQREWCDAPVKRRRHQPVATCCSGPTQKRDTCIGFKEHCVALDSSRGSQAKQWIHR